MRTLAIVLVVGAGCSDPDSAGTAAAGDGCNGCTLEQPVQVTGPIGVEGAVAVVNEGDGALRVQVENDLSVSGPIEVNGTVSMQPPADPLAVAVNGTVPVTGTVTVTGSDTPLRVTVEPSETAVAVQGEVAIAQPEQPLPIQGSVNVANAVNVDGVVNVATPENNPLAVTVEGTVTVDEPVAVTLPDAPVRCVVENNGGGTGGGKASFQGLTQTPRNGAAGLGRLHADCHAAFPNTRLCTDEEILFNSFPVPNAPNSAWLFARPVGGGHGMGLGSGRSYQYSMIVYASGYTARASNSLRSVGAMTNCEHFTQGSGNALVLDATGSISAGACSDERVAACCGL